MFRCITETAPELFILALASQTINGRSLQYNNWSDAQVCYPPSATAYPASSSDGKKDEEAVNQAAFYSGQHLRHEINDSGQHLRHEINEGVWNLAFAIHYHTMWSDYCNHKCDAWNSLPHQLRGIAVASTFSHQLKSELFFQAYGVSTIASTIADPCVLSSFLSASLYFSKRGAYWDRLCRDVVGRLSRACTVAKRCILGL